MTSGLVYRYQRSVEFAASIFKVVHTSDSINIERASLHNFVFNGSGGVMIFSIHICYIAPINGGKNIWE